MNKVISLLTWLTKIAVLINRFHIWQIKFQDRQQCNLLHLTVSKTKLWGIKLQRLLFHVFKKNKICISERLTFEYKGPWLCWLCNEPCALQPRYWRLLQRTGWREEKNIITTLLCGKFYIAGLEISGCLLEIYTGMWIISNSCQAGKCVIIFNFKI